MKGLKYTVAAIGLTLAVLTFWVTSIPLVVPVLFIGVAVLLD